MSALVIPPLDITPAMLVSSSVPEPDASQGETVFVSGATYALGAKAILLATHRKYECLVPGVRTIAPNLDPLNWDDMGATNRWAMFDKLSNSQTIAASPLTVVINPMRRISAWGVVGAMADGIDMSLAVASVPIYTATEPVSLRYTQTASQYRFGVFRNKSRAHRFDVPQASSGVLTLTMTKGSGTVKCGGLSIGQHVYLGNVLASSVVDDLNFSVIERDAFSNANLVPRPSVPALNMTILVQASNLDRLIELKKDLNAVPAYWACLGSLSNHAYSQALTSFGIYRKFRFSLDSAERLTLTLDLEDL